MSTLLILLLLFLASLAAFWGLFSIYAACCTAADTEEYMEKMDEDETP